MAHGNDEVGTHDHLDLTGRNDLALIRYFIMVAIVHGAGDDEELVIVAFEFGTLVSHNCVFHDEFVDAKL